MPAIVNRLIAILLLITLISANLSRLFVYAGFEMNRDYIARELCENKARPWMHCNGKCYLMKKLQQAMEKEKKQEKEEKRNQYQEALPAAPTASIVCNHPIRRRSYPEMLVPAIEQRASSIFQPPKTV